MGTYKLYDPKRELRRKKARDRYNKLCSEVIIIQNTIYKK